MFNTAAIFHAAHAKVRTVLAGGRVRDSYRQLFALHLRMAWRTAKTEAHRIAREALSPLAARIAELKDAILIEECRNRMDFPKVARLRAELSKLHAA